jgi:hypothetical protein
MAACLAYIARWIYKAVQAGREGWAEGMAENNKNGNKTPAPRSTAT